MSSKSKGKGAVAWEWLTGSHRPPYFIDILRNILSSEMIIISLDVGSKKIRKENTSNEDALKKWSKRWGYE